MIFRLATNLDTKQILQNYESVKDSSFCVWNDTYPTIEDIENDILHNNLYVLEVNKQIVGSISIVDTNELDDFNCWHSKKAREFARVVIAKKHQNRGYSKYLVSYCLDEMSKRNYANVHISVAIKNIPAQRLYESLGFKKVGNANMWNNSYYLYEKKL